MLMKKLFRNWVKTLMEVATKINILSAGNFGKNFSNTMKPIVNEET